VYDIDLEQPASTRWAGFAKANGTAIHQLLADTERCVEREIKPYVSASATEMLKFLANGTGWLLRNVASVFGEEYTTEIQSIAKYAEVPVGKLMLGNLIYDFTSLAEMYGCGCSSASFEVDHTPVLVRNMDWVTPRSTGRHTKVINFHRAGHTYTSIAVPGMTGVISAVCDKWAVVVNQAPVVQKMTGVLDWCMSPSLLFKWPALQRVRAACDISPDYANVILNLRKYKTVVPFFAHVIGTRSKEHTVVAHVGDTSTIRTKRFAMVQTNHYVAGRYKKYNPENGEDWCWDTYDRYRDLKRAVARAFNEDNLVEEIKERGLPAALNLLQCVTNEDTMQQMALWPAKSQMVLKIKG